MPGSRAIQLITDTWVQATIDTTSPFRISNESKNKLLWIASPTPPSTDFQVEQHRAVTLTTNETISRFAEMTGCHLYLRGKTSTTVVIIEP